MTRIGARLAIVAYFLFVATQPEAAAFTNTWDGSGVTSPPIWIVNDASDTWDIKVWSYNGESSSTFLSCQTLDRSAERLREIERRVESSEFAKLSRNHCGNYTTVWFWFRLWNRDTGESFDYLTDYLPARWGATWTWDGRSWACSKC